MVATVAALPKSMARRETAGVASMALAHASMALMGGMSVSPCVNRVEDAAAMARPDIAILRARRASRTAYKDGVADDTIESAGASGAL